MLTTTDHSRDSAGLTYVYPVLSRRAGGLSIGINLNPNNACNWRCIYCQVPELVRGSAPPINMPQLEEELRQFVTNVQEGDFFDQQNIEPELRHIKDIALSGNGEPTSVINFDEIIKLIGHVMRDHHLLNKIKLVLITNGSFIQRPQVQKGLQQMAELNGEIWFKVDSATEEGMKRVNSINRTMQSVLNNIDRASRLCPTWIQTCFFEQNSLPPSEEEQAAYLAFLQLLLRNNTPVQGVLLYGLARPSLQPEAANLNPLDTEWLEAFAQQINALPLPVKVSH